MTQVYCLSVAKLLQAVGFQSLVVLVKPLSFIYKWSKILRLKEPSYVALLCVVFLSMIRHLYISRTSDISRPYQKFDHTVLHLTHSFRTEHCQIIPLGFLSCMFKGHRPRAKQKLSNGDSAR